MPYQEGPLLQLQGTCPVRLIRGSSNEDDRNVTAGGCQVTLQFKPTHAGHIRIDNQARGVADALRSEKFLRRGEDFRPQSLTTR